MNQKIKEYLEKKQEIKKDAYEREKKNLLLEEGLYDMEKIPMDELDSVPIKEREVKWDYEEGHKAFYRKVPFVVSDDEYELLKEAYKIGGEEIQKDAQNLIATILSNVAWIVYVCGFVIGISLGISYTDPYSEFNISVAFICWVVTLVNGTMILGFAEIIKLLETIKRK